MMILMIFFLLILIEVFFSFFSIIFYFIKKNPNKSAFLSDIDLSSEEMKNEDNKPDLTNFVILLKEKNE